MKALVLRSPNQLPEYTDTDTPIPLPGQKLVQLHAAALNHRDVYMTQGLYSRIRVPCILGSDGAGMCDERRVLLYPALEWGEQTAAQGKDFRVLGMPDDGTFAEHICMPSSYVFPMPDHLNWEQAAALPLAGLTAWRVLFSRCRLKSGEKVLISGIGGGVALTAMQLAIAAGAEVFVTSGSEEKIEKAIALGAGAGANYRNEGWDKQLKQDAGGFDVIVDSAAGDGFSLFPALCNPGARIGVYGGSLGKVNGLSMQPVFWKQISILGSTMGSPEEFDAMLRFVGAHRIVPVVDTVFPLEEGAAAFERMDRGDQFGKIVLKIA
ncbi:MAG: zinc-binding dehydrogenase [Lewinellaceae bacterium]|nr:zinc-binding dehydrogenase [Lewinellaceae bacterium]MCB9354899.1 zinc-binding dehydrogenase [Lewinellaceae bacterium]